MDLLSEGAEQHVSGSTRFEIIVDHQDSSPRQGTVCRHHYRPGGRRARLREQRVRDRKADHELTPLPGSVAMSGHAATVQLDQGPDQGQSDPQSSARARQRLISLDEQVEHPGQQLGGDADAVVVHADDDLGARPLRDQGDFSSLGSVFRCVIQQVGEHLGQPRRINFQDSTRSFGSVTVSAC